MMDTIIECAEEALVNGGGDDIDSRLKAGNDSDDEASDPSDSSPQIIEPPPVTQSELLESLRLQLSQSEASINDYQSECRKYQEYHVFK